ncbi:MAG: UPF0175 family protein [Candidatus Omnitrophica bacterium]|nr:UPF0175 family protein [Candidatus Omnitrophota bacterium]
MPTPLNIEMVLKKYVSKEISAGEASRRLKINRWEFVDLLRAQHIYLNVELEDLLSASHLAE